MGKGECVHRVLAQPVINVGKPNQTELNAWQIKDLQVNKKTSKVSEENTGSIFMT